MMWNDLENKVEQEASASCAMRKKGLLWQWSSFLVVELSDKLLVKNPDIIFLAVHKDLVPIGK